MSDSIQNSYINRIPPHDNDAEQAVLSCMIFGNDGITAASEVLVDEDFYRPDHKIIFQAITNLYSKGEPVNLVSLKNQIEKMGMLEQVGGLEYLVDLAGLVSTAANAKQYVRIVDEKSTLRKLINASGEISSMSYEGHKELDDIISEAEKQIFNIVQNRKSDEFSHIHEVLASSIDKIEEIYRSDNKITGVETGFADFDAKTTGLQPSDLILIAARPSMGKTAFALNIAQFAAVNNKVPTAIFSLEMSKEQLVNRLLSAQAMLDSQKLRTGNIEQDDWERIAEAIGELSEAPIYIDDKPGISAMELRAKCRKLKMEKGLGLIVIDYLQLMSANGKSDSRQQEISEISRSLKAIAREMEAPVIALSQLSRACEARADHRPMLSDLRESGAIEQDADLVAFLYRDEYYNPETDKKNQAELIIAKQRNGSTGTVDLIWLGAFTKFANMAHDFYGGTNEQQ